MTSQMGVCVHTNVHTASQWLGKSTSLQIAALHHTKLYSIILNCTASYSIALYYTKLNCIILNFTALYSIALQSLGLHTALYLIRLHCSGVVLCNTVVFQQSSFTAVF